MGWPVMAAMAVLAIFWEAWLGRTVFYVMVRLTPKRVKKEADSILKLKLGEAFFFSDDLTQEFKHSLGERIAFTSVVLNNQFIKAWTPKERFWVALAFYGEYIEQQAALDLGTFAVSSWRRLIPVVAAQLIESYNSDGWSEFQRISGCGDLWTRMKWNVSTLNEVQIQQIAWYMVDTQTSSMLDGVAAYAVDTGKLEAEAIVRSLRDLVLGVTPFLDTGDFITEEPPSGEVPPEMESYETQLDQLL